MNTVTHPLRPPLKIKMVKNMKINEGKKKKAGEEATPLSLSPYKHAHAHKCIYIIYIYIYIYIYTTVFMDVITSSVIFIEFKSTIILEFTVCIKKFS